MTFNYRGNPLVQQARHAIARGDIGKPHFLVGHYLQDWLLKDTDYSWRLEPDKGGASSALGDIGSHWCDLAQHISGLRITHVLGDITTVLPKRKKPAGSREAFAAADASQKLEEVDIKVEDLASVLLRFDNGAKGSFSVGQVCAGHKNDCRSKSADRRRRCAGGRNTRTSCGSATATRRTRSCRRIRRSSTRRRAATRTCRAATRKRGRTRSPT